MDISQKERQTRGLDLLGTAVRPLVDARMRAAVEGRDWLPLYEAKESARLGRPYAARLDDPRLMLRVLRFERGVFTEIDATQRAWLDELVQASNRAAHAIEVEQRLADRALDTMVLLAESLGLEEAADEIGRLRALGGVEVVGTEASDDGVEPAVDVVAAAVDGEDSAPAEGAIPQGQGLQLVRVSVGAVTAVVVLREALNYATLHNGMSPIVAVEVANDGDAPVAGVVVTVQLDPLGGDAAPPAAPLAVELGDIAPGEVVEAPRRALSWRLSPAPFVQLDEATELGVRVRLEVGGTSAVRRTTVRALTADEWWGSDHADSIVAFVRPNDRGIVQLLGEASVLLAQRTGSPALLGYQAGPERTVQIATAVYDALRARGITYVVAPPSFERTGQRIRSHAEVLDHRIGNCLDLACTYAAALEHAGLAAVVVVVEGHAFCGFLTEDQNLPEQVVTDPGTIRTLADSDVFIGVETTALCAGESSADFDSAVAATRPWWTLRIDDVQALVDVRAAHRWIRPLPSIRSEGGTRVVEVVREVIAGPVRKVGVTAHVAHAVESAPARIARWKRALLDLSYANPLLKLKPASTVFLHVPTDSLGVLEDQVAAGRSLALSASDEVASLNSALAARSAADVDPVALHKELVEGHRVFVTSTAREAAIRLKGLQRKAATAREETGSDTLYLALGTLEWSERGRDGRAPLFLVPIRLVGGRGQRGYTVEQDPTREVEPNYCLHEKLRNDFGLSLPELVDPGSDESGIDIDGSLRSIRRRLLQHGAAGFHVEEVAGIATFQFSTLGMWRDLQDNWQVLADRAVVKHLVESAGRPYLDPVPVPEPDETAEATTYLPIPADGSQVNAVRWAAAGRSFILEGPPGTGKSQTITNLIAHCLAEGRKVLFVAEKPAALEVVQRRLDEVGLGTFSLDVHGANQTVGAVRTQLQEALEYGTPPSAGWESLRATYRNLVQSLSHYPRHLHETGPAGLSAWDARQVVLDLQESVSPDAPALAVERRVALGLGPVEELYEVAGLFGDALLSIGIVPDRSPWRLAGAPDGGVLDRGAVSAALSRLSRAESALGGGGTGRAIADLDAAVIDPFARWLDSIRAGVGQHPAMAATLATPSWRQHAEDSRRAVEQLRTTSAALRHRFHPEVVEQDLTPLLVQAEAAEKRFFGKKRARLAVLAALAPYRRDAEPVAPESVVTWVRALTAARTELMRLVPYVLGLPGLSLPPTFNPLRDADAELLHARIAGVEASADLGARLVLPESMVTEALRGSGPEAGQVRELGQARAALLEALVATEADLQVWSQGEPWSVARERTRLAWESDAAGGGLLQLERWVRVRALATRLEALGGGDVARAGLSGVLRGADVEPAVRLAVAHEVLQERLDTTDLRSFDPEHHSRLVERFITTGEDVRARLVAELPARIVAARTFDARQQVGAVGELRQQIARRRGGLSIRALLHRYAPIMTEVTPCFLMSPVSVAKFLPAGSVEFDVVVFDEASQIRVPEAIGAMGRGRSVVIVGDSQQMPPSSMFSASGSNDEEESSGESELPVPVDMDSILTEGVEANLPRLMLSWHYRSRDESLIAFSNQHYYEGRLASFPAPPDRTGTAAVRLSRIDGVWEGGSRGAARVNRAEAEAVCEEIGRQLRDHPGRSIGVVTFNMQQRNLVLDLLEQAAERDGVLAAALTRADEPLFVKNLENVQGDERDVILFTLAFAKDARGKVPLNWGPLTRVGGEKRLNVAVTRAKEEVVVFCSFEAHELDLSTSRSEGLAHLKDYLLLARDGVRHALVKRGPSFDLHVREVRERLEASGLEVRSAIGLSTFTVDLAVRASVEHPWLAVLLDGPAWAERLSVGDRDGLPAAVLTGRMGWAGVTRIWLAEWVRDADAVVRGVHERAQMLPWPEVVTAGLGVVDGGGDRQLEPDIADPSVLRIGRADDAATQVADLAAAARERVETAADATGAPGRAVSSSGALATAAVAGHMAMPAGGAPTDRARFRQADTTARHDRAVLDEPGRRSARLVAEELADVVAAEGPILTARLAKLTAHRFGLDRLRETREKQILDRLPAGLVRRSANGDRVAWPEGTDHAAYRDFRVPGDERTVADVPYEELRNAMLQVVRSAFSLGHEDCLRETARVFGWSRLGSNVRDRLDGVLHAAAHEGLLVPDGEQWRVGA